MNSRFNRLLTLSLILFFAFASGCIEDEQPQNLSADELSSAVMDHVRTALSDGSKALGGVASLFDETFETDDEQEDILQWLAEMLFDPDNIVWIDEQTGLYRLPVEAICEGDPDCTAELEGLDLAIRVTLVSEDGVNIAIELGDATPLRLEIRGSTLMVSLNIDALRSALTLFVEDSSELPERMTGEVTLDVTFLEDDGIQVALSIVRAIGITFASEMGNLELDVAEAVPFLSAIIDANNDRFLAAVAGPTIDLLAPLGFLVGTSCEVSISEQGNVGTDCTPETNGQTIGLHLAGLTGQIEASADSSAFSIQGFGFGAESSYVALNDDVVFTLDLNPNSGRTLDVTVSESDGEQLSLTVSPELDLQTEIDLFPFTDWLTDLPEWTFGEVMGIAMTGSELPSVLASADDSGSIIEVLSGVLRLSSLVSQTAEIQSGECLFYTLPDSTDQHPFDELSYGPCSQR